MALLSAVPTTVTAARTFTKTDLNNAFEINAASTSFDLTLAADVEAPKGGVSFILLHNTGTAHAVTVKAANDAKLSPTSPISLVPRGWVILVVTAAKTWSVLLSGVAEQESLADAVDVNGVITKAIDGIATDTFGPKLEAMIKKTIKTALGNGGIITASVANVAEAGSFGQSLKTVVEGYVDSRATDFEGAVQKLVAPRIEELIKEHFISSGFEKLVLSASSGRKLIGVRDMLANSDKNYAEFELESGYGDYDIEFNNVATDQNEGVYFVMQISKGTTGWENSGYALSQLEERGGKAADSELHSANASALTLQGNLSNAKSTSISGRIRLVQPGRAGYFHHFLMDTISTLKSGDHVRTEGGAVFTANNDAYNKVRFFFCKAGAVANSGNMTNGVFRVYGLTDEKPKA